MYKFYDLCNLLEVKWGNACLYWIEYIFVSLTLAVLICYNVIGTFCVLSTHYINILNGVCLAYICIPDLKVIDGYEVFLLDSYWIGIMHIFFNFLFIYFFNKILILIAFYSFLAILSFFTKSSWLGVWKTECSTCF